MLWVGIPSLAGEVKWTIRYTYTYIVIGCICTTRKIKLQQSEQIMSPHTLHAFGCFKDVSTDLTCLSNLERLPQRQELSHLLYLALLNSCASFCFCFKATLGRFLPFLDALLDTSSVSYSSLLSCQLFFLPTLWNFFWFVQTCIESSPGYLRSFGLNCNICRDRTSWNVQKLTGKATFQSLFR